MKRALLEHVVEAVSAGRAVVLIRSLERDRQWLFDELRGADDGDLSEELRERARQALARDGASAEEVGGEQYLLQTLAPPARVVVVGAVHVAQKLIPMARIAGFGVVLVDPRPAFATAERFPDTQIVCDWPQHVMPKLALNARTAVVTLSHDAKIDEPALQAALASKAFYVGALGSKKNHAKRIERLAALGIERANLARIAAPIGLPLGGRSPGEIAVAILAQIIQTRYAPDPRL